MRRGKRDINKYLVEPPIFIQFEGLPDPDLGEPVRVDLGIPFQRLSDKDKDKRGVARGRLDTAKEAARLAREGIVLSGKGDEEGEDITEREINRFLMAHRGLGTEFVRVDRTGSKVEVDPMDPVILQGQGYYCRPCEQELNTAAARTNHCKSTTHTRNLDEWVKTRRGAVAA